MHTKWFLWRVLGTLVAVGLLVGLLTVGGWAIHRASWSQGYAAGQLAAGSEESEVVPETLPHMPYGLGYPRWYLGFPPFFFGLGLIFKIGLLFLLLVVIGNVFRWLTWRKVMMTGGPWAMGTHHHRDEWSKHWHQRHGPPPHHGPVPPWCWSWEEPSKEEAEEAQTEPDVETDATEV